MTSSLVVDLIFWSLPKTNEYTFRNLLVQIITNVFESMLVQTKHVMDRNFR